MSRPVIIASMMREHGETGVQTHVLAAREWLRRNGHAVQLVTPFDAPRWLVYPVFGVRRLIDRLSKPASVWWYRHWHAVFLRLALRRTLAGGEPCVVYTQCPLSADAALRARSGPAQQVAMVVHFNLSQADEWAGKRAIAADGIYFRAIRQFEARVLPRLDALVYVSEFMRQALEQRIPVLSSVVSRVVPNFLDDPGLPEPTLTEADLIVVGTLEARKNQAYALDIVHAASQLGRTLTLTIVGDGPDRAGLERRVAELGLASAVRFTGFVVNAAALMPRHRACLHVAQMESFGIVLIEAMARGLPVFAPRAGGMPEVFEDGTQGRLIPLDEPMTAARLILQWLDDEQTMNAARDAARRRFLDCFEARRVAAELADFFEEVALHAPA